MGLIYNSWAGGSCVGRVDGGLVYDSWAGGSCVGRVEGGSPNASGAALLLLLLQDSLRHSKNCRGLI